MPRWLEQIYRSFVKITVFGKIVHQVAFKLDILFYNANTLVKHFSNYHAAAFFKYARNSVVAYSKRTTRKQYARCPLWELSGSIDELLIKLSELLDHDICIFPPVLFIRILENQ